MGGLLKEMKEDGQRHSGRGDQKTGSQGATPKLADLGVTKSSSSRWQTVAELPEDRFERVIADTVATELNRPAAQRRCSPAATSPTPFGRRRDDRRWRFLPGRVLPRRQGYWSRNTMLSNSGSATVSK